MKKIISAPVRTVTLPDGPWNEREAAFYLRQKPRTLRLWRLTRGLPHSKVTTKVILYTKNDIDQWLGRQRVAVMG